MVSNNEKKKIAKSTIVYKQATQVENLTLVLRSKKL